MKFIVQQWSMVNGWIDISTHGTTAEALAEKQKLEQRYKGVYKFGSSHRIIPTREK